jgi:nucleoside phosphorylase
MPKILIFCAHRWEAQPFLERLDMHPVAKPAFPFAEFKQANGEHSLFLTGQGSDRAAAVVASVLSRLPDDDSRVVANFGTSGSRRESFEIGASVLVNRSVAVASGRSFYPDRLVRCSWPEATCYTLARPSQDVPPSVTSSVYDMELSGVLSGCELYLHTSQIVAGKVVSDYLSEKPPDWREMVEAITKPYALACQTFVELLTAQRKFLNENRRHLQAETANRLVTPSLRRATDLFTVTQCRQLESALRARALSCQDEKTWTTTTEELEQLMSEGRDNTKSERSKLFARILEHVSSPVLFSSGET